MKDKNKYVQLSKLIGWLPVLVITGCASTTPTSTGTMGRLLSEVNISERNSIKGMQPLVQVAPSPLQRYINENNLNGMRSQVLNDMEAGVVAIEIGAFEYARALFADAYTIVDSVYANNDAAKAARSKFVPEANKDYKGDPYERAMIGYYLGLSDIAMGDRSNARASFKWGELQDTMSASTTYQSDMALHNLLIGWIDHCEGDYDLAESSYNLATKYSNSITKPDENHNVLFIAESGLGPKKYSTGKHGEELRYTSRDDTSATSVMVQFDGMEMNTDFAESTYYQASTLGGRAVDAILAGKASFKDTADSVADVAGTVATVSSTLMQHASITGDYIQARQYAEFGLAGSLLSFGARMAAEKAKPAADTRYWGNLPAKIFTRTAEIKGPLHSDSIGYRYANITKTITPSVFPAGKCYVVWGSDREMETWKPGAMGAWVSLSPDASISNGLIKPFDENDVDRSVVVSAVKNTISDSEKVNKITPPGF